MGNFNAPGYGLDANGFRARAADGDMILSADGLLWIKDNVTEHDDGYVEDDQMWVGGDPHEIRMEPTRPA